jgi:glycosyltransferase involved in cell wall biosynthesis
MKILFVHEVSWQKKVTYEIHDFPELLQLRGHDVSFIEYDEASASNPTKAKITKRHFWGTESICTRAHCGSSVRVITPWRIFPSIFGRLFAVFFHPLVILRELVFNRPDVITIYSIPTNGWQTIILARLFKIPTLFRAIDVLHQIRDTKYSRFVHLAEKFVYRNANYVCTNNEELLQYCINRGASPEKSSVVYPGIDTDRFFPAPPHLNLQKKLGIQSTDSVLLFMGTIFRFSGLNELIVEFRWTFLKNPSLKFLIVGDGEDFAQLLQLVNTFGLQRQVLLPGRIEYDVLADYIRLGHVALLPFRLELVTNGALPGKVLQYLACGLPTIATSLIGLRSMIPQSEGVLYVNDLNEMAKTALHLLSDAERRIQLSTSGVKIMNFKCNWLVQIDSFENILNQVQKV